MSSVCLSVRVDLACVHPSVMLLPWYLWWALMDFHQTLISSASWDVDDGFGVKRSKVKVTAWPNMLKIQLWGLFLQTYKSSPTHSLWHSRIRGPSHALTLAAWNLTHLSTVVLCSTALQIVLHLKCLLLSQQKVTPNCCHQMRFLVSRCLRNASAAGLCCPGLHWIVPGTAAVRRHRRR